MRQTLSHPVVTFAVALGIGSNASCFSPSFPDGVPCSAELECPGDQFCAADGRCYTETAGSTALAALEVSAGSLVPPFDPEVTDYTLDLGLRPAALAVTATPLDTAVELTFNGAVTTTGQPSSLALEFGANAVEVTVTGSDSTTTLYTIAVNRGAAMAHRAYIKASNADANDRFRVVALSGDTLAVGAPGEASASTLINGDESDNSAQNAGAVYIFVRGPGGSWTQQAYIKPSIIDAGDNFGASVDLDGDTLVVGAPFEDSPASDPAQNSAMNAGAAYVFVRNGEIWTQQAFLNASNADAGDKFGQFVAVSGDSLAVGVPLEASVGRGVDSVQQDDNTAMRAGAAYVFVRSAGSWSQQAYIKASNTDANDEFGVVDIEGDVLIVGAPGEGSGSPGPSADQSDDSQPGAGAVYAFMRTGTVWSQTDYIKSSTPENIDNLGSALALEGDVIVAGAFNEHGSDSGINGNEADNSSEHAGAAYVFRRMGNTWTQEAYVKASNPDPNDNFGQQVALDGVLLAISSPGEQSAAQGVNGDQSDDGLNRGGAIYQFALRGPTLVQQAYIKPTNTDALDFTGRTGLAVSAEGTIVFSTLDDSSARGIDGDETDNSAADSGAVFVVE